MIRNTGFGLGLTLLLERHPRKACYGCFSRRVVFSLALQSVGGVIRGPALCARCLGIRITSERRSLQAAERASDPERAEADAGPWVSAMGLTVSGPAVRPGSVTLAGDS